MIYHENTDKIPGIISKIQLFLSGSLYPQKTISENVFVKCLLLDNQNCVIFPFCPISLVHVMPSVEFPKSEVRGRAENRSSTVARPSTGGASSGKFAPPRSPESLKACRGPARLLHPLPRGASSSPAPADFSLTRPNQLGSCNETQDISSRIY